MNYFFTLLFFASSLTVFSQRRVTDLHTSPLRLSHNHNVVDTISSNKSEEKNNILEESITEEIQIEEVVPSATKELAIDEVMPEKKINLEDEYFSVQIAASKTLLSENFFGSTPVYFFKNEDGFVRYYSNKFNSLSEASNYRKTILASTKFKEAFVVKLKGATKVSLN